MKTHISILTLPIVFIVPSKPMNSDPRNYFHWGTNSLRKFQPIRNEAIIVKLFDGLLSTNK